MKFTLACSVLAVALFISVEAVRVDVEAVLEESIQDAKALEDAEIEAALATHFGSGVTKHVMAFLSSSRYTKRAGYSARAQLNAMKKVQALTGLKGKQLLAVMKEDFGCSIIPNKRIRIKSDTALPNPKIDECPFPEIECDETAMYRSIDGTCNNQLFPHNGRANRALARFLEADYSDGIEEPRKAKSGKELPSARNVSLGMFDADSKPSGVHTLMHMALGQFVDHDVDKTAISKLMQPDDTMVDFDCGETGCETEGINNTECFPISVDKHDPDFSNKKCLMFVRSQEYMKDGCEIGVREQPNQITSYIDASNVYGSSKEMTKKLRDSDSKRGKMKVTDNSPHKPLLPQIKDSACRDLDDKVKCFNAGDARRNEQVGLISLHTMFVRFHNHLEEKLHETNPHWDGEKLFQESRRLLIAVWQNIVYDEFLPILLGPNVMRKYKLKLQRNGYFEGYDQNVNGDTRNVFATAAFRYGHSQIVDRMRFTDKTYKKSKELPFSSLLFRPRPIYESPVHGTTGIDAAMFGLVSQPVEASDRFFTKEMSAKLFSEHPPHGRGTDLCSLNIQRGRDHGIPGYTAWRKWCGLSIPKNFDNLDDIPLDVRIRLANIYEDVDDIDLFPAGLAEYPVMNGLVGPTFTCILAQQFRIFKVADRFWFETNDPLLKFSPEQLANIRKVTLSRVLCDTLDDVERIQRYSMLQPQKVAVATGFAKSTDYWEYLSLFYKGSKNNRRPCEKLPEIDFDLWKMM